MLGVLAFGFLSDNVLKKKMYLTITFVTFCQIIYNIISFVFDEEIA
jgi:hypothetical protein